VRENPADGARLLHHNPSFIFFREVNEVPSDRGPLGAMNRSVTALRSIAVDPQHVPLGAPVWIEKDGRSPMRRLMVAQDTGSAIKGAQRADIFFGTGPAAGGRAGRVRDPGRIVVLLPVEVARRLARGG
jgi:membrane-bound lytic murein transglycosylase A